jgi:acyl-CoA thioesterase I
MVKTGIAFLVASALTLSILSAGCRSNNTRKKSEQNGSSRQSEAPMIRSSPGDFTTRPLRYAALGDSTGAGVGAKEGGYVARIFRRIVAQKPDAQLTNLCVSGATSVDVLSDQLDLAIRTDPMLVTLGVGINDIGMGLSLEQFGRNFEQILNSLQRNTRATIVITNVPDISSAPRIPEQIRSEYLQQIIAFNRKLEEIAASNGITVFDIYTITHERLPSHPEYFSEDGFHPSDKGYELWAEQMWPTIAGIVGLDIGDEP